MRSLPLPAAALALVFLVAAAAAASAAEPVGERSAADVDRTVQQLAREAGEGAWTKRRGGPPRVGWNFRARGAWLHQFRADIDDGGRMDVDRLLVQARVGYSPKPSLPLSITFGYRYDGYRFDRGGVFGGAPWDDIHSLRASIPLGYPLGKRWFLFALPTVRTTVESGAPLEDGVTWGLFGGVLFKVNDRLAIGPGGGILGELETDPSLFPVLLIEWAITPTLTFKTGEGLGATQGPGLFLEWKPTPRWTLSLGGRYERNRFRLDDRGVAPGGIGQERAYALLLAAEYAPRTNMNLFASVGTSLLGNLRLEDRRGDLLHTEDYDPALFVGLGLNFKF